MLTVQLDIVIFSVHSNFIYLFVAFRIFQQSCKKVALCLYLNDDFVLISPVAYLFAGKEKKAQ